MELATQALGILLPKLGNLLTDEYKLHKGVRGDIRFLQVEMESMQAVLNILSKQPPHEITDLDMIWVKDLKELSYDIEDSVDTFMVHIDTPIHAKLHSFRRFFNITMGLLTKAKVRHRIANDIEDIKRRIHEVADRRGRYKLEVVAARPHTTTVDPRVLACFEHAAKLVGTDVPVEKISNLLTKEKGIHKQKLMVVSIVGVGGLGKTTIANLVYERLGGQFDCQAFVSVSLRPDMKQILSSILRQVSKGMIWVGRVPTLLRPAPHSSSSPSSSPLFLSFTSMKDQRVGGTGGPPAPPLDLPLEVSKGMCTNVGEMEPDELIRNIRQFLEDKRYFIVIDDVWSEEAWKTIEGALVDSNLGSKVVVTTRNVDVAKVSSVSGAMYELDPLSNADSKKLLSKRIFDEEEGILSELEDVTMKILKKCGGIPLAIITIASMLASIPNKSKYEWYDVYKSMGSGLEKDKSVENMRGILQLSYCDLPSYLKPCLLHLSMFPEDSKILREELICIWIEEGFVDGEQGSNFYALGERYFNELVNRSMIQPHCMDEFGVATACRVHDMILDLIVSLSAQVNFVTISSGLHIISPARKIRRLSLQGSEQNSNAEDVKDKIPLPTSADMSHVRTLIAFGDAVQWMPPLSRFSILRVLVLKCFPSKNNNLKGLGSLHHLRYLELRGEVESEHLEEIGNLKHLKVLDLWDTPITKLPPSIVQLRQLERLITKGGVMFPDGIGNLVSLQQLQVLDVRKSPQALAELGKFVGLEDLTVSGLLGLAGNDDSCVKTFLQGLSNLHNIHTLNILDAKFCSLDCMPDQWSGPAHLQCFNGCDSVFLMLPRWFSSLSELSCLSIKVNMLRQDDLQLLGALPVLRILHLTVGYTEERLVIGADQPFRSLTDFKFWLYARCCLVLTEGVMPKLQNLELYFEAGKGESGGFDVRMEKLTSLKQVKVMVDCHGARIREAEDAETKCRDTIDKHPNHPILELSRELESYMVQDEDKAHSEAKRLCRFRASKVKKLSGH